MGAECASRAAARTARRADAAQNTGVASYAAYSAVTWVRYGHVDPLATPGTSSWTGSSRIRRSTDCEIVIGTCTTAWHEEVTFHPLPPDESPGLWSRGT